MLLASDIPFGVSLLSGCISVFALGILIFALTLVARSKELNGLGKVGWILAVLFVPILGSVAYLIVAAVNRGRGPENAAETD